MRYLEICSMDGIKKNGDVYHGVIDPQTYDLWVNMDPLCLYVEGVHQFCAKLVMKYHRDDVIRTKKRIVPSMIKEHAIHGLINKEKYYISGTFEVGNDIYKVRFTVYDLESGSCQNEISNGQLFLSEVFS